MIIVETFFFNAPLQRCPRFISFHGPHVVIIQFSCRKKHMRKKKARSAAHDAQKLQYNLHSVRSDLTGVSTESTLESKLDDFDCDSVITTRQPRNGQSTGSRSVITHVGGSRTSSQTPWQQQHRLPVDLRSAAGSSGHLHAPSARDGSSRTANGFSVGSGRVSPAANGSRPATSDDVRHLVNPLLDMKHRLEEYIQAGIHLERRRQRTATDSSRASPQYDVLAAICDVSSRVSDVIARHSRTTMPLSIAGGTARHGVSLSAGSGRLPPSELISPAYLVEYLSMLRPRIDQLARVLARSVRSGGHSRSSAEVSSLETVLANVGASVSLAIDIMTETYLSDPNHCDVLLPTPGVVTSSRPSSRQADVYSRVRHPPPSRQGGGNNR